jgi:hypothetical protein
MYKMRRWSVRNARWLKKAYHSIEYLLVKAEPLLQRIGYERLDKPFLAIEKLSKGLLFDSKSCGQCILGSTGLSCPMNCPKMLRNGPCGGVRADGSCEINPDMDCVWVLAWEGNQRLFNSAYPIQVVQPAVDNRLANHSAWLNELHKLRQKRSASPLSLVREI